MNIKYTLLFVFIFIASCLSAQIVDIIDLHQNDQYGEPAAPYSVGSRVIVQGVITVGAGIYTRSYLDIFVQDETAGINIYDPGNDLFHLKSGNYVRVAGTIKQYQGLTEIVNPSVSVLAENSPLPEPLVLTCDQLSSSFLSDYSEPNESRLVRINQVRVTEADHPEYTLSDTSGSTILYIRDATGLRPPPGTFDVIGIVKQYDRSRPYTSGYEIIPRYPGDIISSGIVYLQAPKVTDLSAQSLQVTWTTDIASGSEIRWGQTPAMEMPALTDTTRVTEHNITLEGLSSASLYFIQAVSTTAAGSALSDTIRAMTASDASTGQIIPYFTKTIKPELAENEIARGYTDLAQILLRKINNATYSIDACFYSLTHESIAAALTQAHNRGVQVRFIYEKENENSLIRSLINDENITAIADDFGDNDGSGLMHNKFVIIDHRDFSSATDDWLCTGSANASYNGMSKNVENMIFIQDETLCAAYTTEFNEMWGSDDNYPDPTRSRFGDRKRDNTPHQFKIGDIYIEQYMSPSDNTEKEIIDVIQSADRSIYFAIYAFTSDNIAVEMQKKFYTLPELWLRGVMDYENADYGLYETLSGGGADGWKPPADVHLDHSTFLMHHKYMLVDAFMADSDPVVVTGSHNWTISANRYNDENTLIIHSPEIANLYLQEFASLYEISGGQNPIVTGIKQIAQHPLPQTPLLKTNYPNPFNGSTVIPVQWVGNLTGTRLVITDLLGREVYERTIQQNQAEIHLDLSQFDLSSGLYFARIHAEELSNSIKLLYIK
ncbi:T9SS type A sorting domain-containing protein [candidate division KSB1 bacterium]|nr:T9SS type A sorting domain-containing protein [candidate division KSB1 bacterium]